MSVKIRLKRVGTRNTPVYRVVVTDSRSPRDGRFIEEIGTYAPRKAVDNFKVDMERVSYWLGKGAQPSDTLRTLLKKTPKPAQTAAA
jgi:small subunit ribosomal protein S16